MNRYLQHLLAGSILLISQRSGAEGDAGRFVPKKEEATAGRVGEKEVLKALANLDTEEQAALSADADLRQQVVQLTVVQQLLLKDARAQQWDQRPEVAAKMERAREKALAGSWLESQTEPPADYPAEAEIQAAYDAHKEALSTPRQYRLAQIFIACPPSAGNEEAAKAKARLADVKKQLSSYKKDFSTIAAAFSEAKTGAGKGGEIGWLTDAQIQPELRPLVSRLIKHEVSSPVRLADGWHILKCLDRREAGTPSLAEVRSGLVKQLRAEKTKANSEALVTRLLLGNPVTVNEVALSEVLNQKPK